MTNEREEPSRVTITLHCPYCGSEALVREGHAPNPKRFSIEVLCVESFSCRLITGVQIEYLMNPLL